MNQWKNSNINFFPQIPFTDYKYHDELNIDSVQLIIIKSCWLHAFSWLSLSHHLSISAISFGNSSRRQPMFAQSWCVWAFVSQAAVCAYLYYWNLTIGVSRSWVYRYFSQQWPASISCVILIVYEIESKCCFVMRFCLVRYYWED